MMKRLSILSIALVTLMALTIVSGAGVITASAATSYVMPTATVTITQDGQMVATVEITPLSGSVFAPPYESLSTHRFV